MQDYETKYLEEKKKYDNLMKMQQTLLTDTDYYISAFITIRNAITQFDSSASEQSDDVSTQEAQIIAQKAAELLTAKQSDCQCERWRNLYQQQSAQSARLSQEKQQLALKLITKQKEEQADRIEVSSLLQDYLALYKKEIRSENPRKLSQKKEKRSKSKGTQPTTEKKPKQVTEELKEDHHAKQILQKWQRALSVLQEQVQTLRQELVQKEGIIQLYRTRQRRHLLSGGQLLD